MYRVSTHPVYERACAPCACVWEGAHALAFVSCHAIFLMKTDSVLRPQGNFMGAGAACGLKIHVGYVSEGDEEKTRVAGMPGCNDGS